MGRARAAVVDEREALAFRILEVERRGGRRARSIVASLTPCSREACRPPVEARRPATRRPVRDDAVVPRRSRSTGQSKKVRSVPGDAWPSA